MDQTKTLIQFRTSLTSRPEFWHYGLCDRGAFNGLFFGNDHILFQLRELDEEN